MSEIEAVAKALGLADAPPFNEASERTKPIHFRYAKVAIDTLKSRGWTPPKEPTP